VGLGGVQREGVPRQLTARLSGKAAKPSKAANLGSLEMKPHLIYWQLLNSFRAARLPTCARAGFNLLDGWGKQVLGPQLSAFVTPLFPQIVQNGDQFRFPKPPTDPIPSTW
jgi:hypothetical protein